MKSAYYIQHHDEDIYIAAKQMSQYVLGTDYVDIDSTYTYIDLENREMCFELDNHRIVKTPGFEILLSDVDDLYFERDHDMIYVIIERNETRYRFLLTYAHEKGMEDNDEIQE